MDQTSPACERAEPAPLKPRPKPPVGRRFQPGQSGNPAGRPRRVSTPSTPAALERALKGRVTLETGGRPRRLSVTEALIQSMIDRALAGDTAARRDLLKAKAELDAAAAARREAARLAREEKARAEAEAAERAAIAADTEPVFPAGWDYDQFLDILQKWNICVRRGDKVYLRQWVASEGLFNGPAADEGDPWAWRGALDPVGDRRSQRKIAHVQAAIARGDIDAAEAPYWPPARPLGEDDADGEAEEAEAVTQATPPPAEPAAAPLPVSPPPPEPPPPQEDFIDRLCRNVGGSQGEGGWMG